MKEKASHLGTFLWACLKALDRKRRKGILLPLSKGVFGDVLWLKTDIMHPWPSENLQKSASYCLLKMLQHTHKKLRKFMFCNRNFPHIKTRIINYWNDLSKWVSNQNMKYVRTEKVNEKNSWSFNEWWG